MTFREWRHPKVGAVSIEEALEVKGGIVQLLLNAIEVEGEDEASEEGVALTLPSDEAGTWPFVVLRGDVEAPHVWRNASVRRRGATDGG